MESARAALQNYKLGNVKETGRQFGRGSYGAVVEVVYKGLVCAAKKLYTELYEQGIGDHADRFVEECKLLSELRHPNIVQFVGVWFESTASRVPVLVMEFLPTTLTQCVERYDHLPEEITYSILRDVALGLRYLHERNKPIIHRDLSANNVLLTGDMRAKIADLGVAKIYYHLGTKEMTQKPGTQSYMPPEVMVHNPRYNMQVDIFSYGVMVVHVFSGQWPVPSDCSIIVSDREADREAGRRQKYLDVVGRDHPLMELILHCLKDRPSHRPVIAEVFRQVSNIASRFPPTYSDKIAALRRMEFDADEMQTMITEKNGEIQHLRDETEAKIEKLRNELQTKIVALQKELDARQQIAANHQQPVPNLTNYYDILLLGSTGIGKSTTGNEMLGLHTEDKLKRFMLIDDVDESKRCLSITSQCKVLSSKEEIRINGVSRLRILDTPGFQYGSQPSQSVRTYETNFQRIVDVQAELEMKFRRIVYFLPRRGILEIADKELQGELKAMYHYFGNSIFECMVLAGTNHSDAKYQRPGMEFDSENNKLSQKVFQVAMRKATGDETLCCPPVVYIGLSSQYPGGRIIADILSARVKSDEGLQLKICETG